VKSYQELKDFIISIVNGLSGVIHITKSVWGIVDCVREVKSIMLNPVVGLGQIRKH
jgi:hypothetical protein